MKYREYLRKAETLAREVVIDVDNACYNKAISALWFVIEAVFRAILNYYKQSIPSRSGAVIAKTINFMRDLGLGDREARELSVASTLYTLRNEVDHKWFLADENTIRRGLICVRRIFRILRKIVHDRIVDLGDVIDNIASKFDKIEI